MIALTKCCAALFTSEWCEGLSRTKACGLSCADDAGRESRGEWPKTGAGEQASSVTLSGNRARVSR